MREEVVAITTSYEQKAVPFAVRRKESLSNSFCFASTCFEDPTPPSEEVIELHIQQSQDFWYFSLSSPD
jgi:hypothetical protein